MTYAFNPEDYGFEHVSNFPELVGFYGNTTYIKVLAISGVNYWYKACYKYSTDDRWVFLSNAHTIGDKEYSRDNQIYSGTISSPEYAEMLLKHLFGTCMNSGVETDGVQRLQQNINADRLNG